MTNDIDKIRQGVVPLDAVDLNRYTQPVLDYFAHYGLDVPNPAVEHIFGSFKADAFDIAAHIYIPPQHKATVILMHGYLSHSGQLKHIIATLIANQYAVALYDMPGHGLSTGPKGSIEDFAQYGSVLKTFRNLVAGYTDTPVHIVAFSLGACAPIAILLNGDSDLFDKVILVSPLVRPVAWIKSKLSYMLYKPFRTSVPRLCRNNSGDTSFLKFTRDDDYLNIKKVPLKWVKALYKWNARIKRADPCDKEIFVIQGQRDSTIDWKYNLKYIRSRFTNAQIYMLAGAKHELLNETAELREDVLGGIIDHLKK